MNNYINNSGIFNGSVNNKIGNGNETEQYKFNNEKSSTKEKKKDRIRFDFQGLVYDIYKKVQFVMYFIYFFIKELIHFQED